MPIYKCDKCLKIFQKPSQLLQHNKRKKPCNVLINKKDETTSESENDNITLCSDISFNQNYSINSDDKLNDIIKILNELKKDNEILKKEVKKLKIQIKKKEIVKKSKQINQYITNINNVYNINVNDYGHEKIDYIDEKMVNTALSKEINVNDYILRYIIKKHFNPDHPENHNIYIPYAKKDQIKLLVNGQWVDERKTLIIPLFIEKNLEKVDELIQLTKSNDPITYSKFLKTIEKANNDLMLDNGNYKEISGYKKQIYKDVEAVCYVNRDIVKNNYDKAAKKAYNQKETDDGYSPLGLAKNYISVN